ncbi:hypothetical protein [Absidia glauca]|uniref:Peptidase S8/S53 domain-containing protein n=1 Tax=Absidia glauca TaxID=4829 RepID=A0A168S1X2_ABSGL|nr:hypothetical protein [Absidia glauca]
MRLILIASAILCLTVFTDATPTHIIKFKEPFNLTHANALLVSSHRAYVKSNEQTMIRKSDFRATAKEANPSQWQLNPIKVGDNFVAMTGVFQDIQFLDYLTGENGVVDYVEANQYYQADMIVPTQLKADDASVRITCSGFSDSKDQVPSYSDTGKCVSLYAPGSNIKSTWIGSKQATQILDGTSMSSPHVSGIAAILMSQHSYGSVNELYDALRSLATPDVLTFNPAALADVNNRNLLAYYVPA